MNAPWGLHERGIVHIGKFLPRGIRVFLASTSAEVFSLRVVRGWGRLTTNAPTFAVDQSVRASQGAIQIEAILVKMALMKEVAAREAKNRFGHLLDAAQSGPVRVTRKGRAVGVMMSVQQYERLRGTAWERLAATMDALGEEASANGLTKARLEALLADES